ncbi:MAG: hypothetical protein UX51_C0039G0001 [Candidatus Azambacteria bacterium GW2011_GWF2_46_32]|uniref:Bacterial type II secretion system protein E domain-containing protein n=1 Tax=Candidatus Azambacteria bacterium GW2011_GWF2_46_32 TaxID=1618628 RepID=A0A0G1SUF3_9BACT|nr:MAG: hypothetical protein UX51_C0039G0001 [Candidatus Azambacteria bacterium GW2011_GWF2_46_32]
MVDSLLTKEQAEKLEREREVDFSYSFKDKGRFRINVFYQRNFLGAALRLIPAEIRTVEQLRLPPIINQFTRYNQGFFLVVGPSGHGKSTTLAALVDEINHKRNDHIITIEDPIEYLFLQDRCIVDQREVGSDTLSFHRALRAVLRQDPDVIMVGELRDPETMSTAITAAETGHLVFASIPRRLTELLTVFLPASRTRLGHSFPRLCSAFFPSVWFRGSKEGEFRSANCLSPTPRLGI